MKELLLQLSQLDEQIDALLAHDELTPEQQAEHDRLVSEREKTMAKINKERSRLQREEERQRLEADAQAAESRRQNQERREERTVAGDRRLTDAAGAVTPARTTLVGQTSIPANVRRVQVRNLRSEEQAYRFGMWALAQLTQQLPGRYRFSSAVDWVNRNMAAVTSTDSSGYSNLIPEEFGRDLIDLRERYGVVRRLFRNVPMMSDTRTDPRRSGGLTAYFVTEGAAGTESNKTWDNVGLTAKDLMVLSRYTNQVGMDAVISVGDDLAGEIAYAFAYKEDLCGFIGDGSNTYGGIRGVSPALYAAAGSPTTTSAGGIIVGAGNLFSELTLANFHSVVGLLPQYADTQNAVWACHRSFYFGTMQRLELASGGVPAMEIREGNRRPRPLFLGYPVEMTQVMPSTDSNTQICALLGDFSLATAFGDRQQDEIAFSEHATIGSENVFERNQIAIRGTERFDINVHDVGSSSAAGPIVGLLSAAS